METVSLLLPTISSFATGSIPQTNPSIGTQPPPYSLIFTGTQYLSSAAVTYTWTGNSGGTNGAVHFASSTSVVAKVPPGIPSSVTSITATLCNVAGGNNYCASAQNIPISSLAATTGTLTAAPNPAAQQQPVTLTANFVATAGRVTPPGAPTGTVTFSNGASTLGTGKLILDKTSGGLTQIVSTTTSSPPTYLGMRLIDLNGDGIPDLIFLDSSAKIHVLLGTIPYGNFQNEIVTTANPNCASPNSFDVGDVNGDGYPDIAVNCTGSVGSTIFLSVLLGNGDGTFGAPITVNGYNTTLVAIKDVNKDGFPDLVMSGKFSIADCSPNCQYGFVVATGNGTGTFTFAFDTETSTTTAPALQMLVTDVDGDGYPDIVALNTSNNSINIYRNQSGTSFGTVSGSLYTPSASIALGGSTHIGLFSADFNNDGLPDLGVIVLGSSNGITTALNTSTSGNISFAAPATFTIPSVAINASAGDFNGDGNQDIAVIMSTGVQVYDGNGAGTFSTNYSGLTATPGSTVVYGVAADLNADGDADLVLATSGGASAPVYSAYSYITSGSANATLATSFASSGTASLTASWPGNLDFLTSTGNLSLPVNGKTTPTINWSTPSAITYGTALSATQLNATATSAAGGVVPGTFVYTPAAGTVLTAGANQPLSVSFTPTDTTDYNSATGNTTITVNKATPTVSWTTPSPITYGTALSATQLNATATGIAGALQGSYIYTPAAGTVLTAGTQNLSVNFAPTDITDYNNATGNTTLTVGKATPTITWATPSPIVIGTPLSATQLNASATGIAGALAGSFVYTPPAGTVLGAGNNQALSVAFTPTDTTDYAAATGNTTLNVITVAITSINPTSVPLGNPNTPVTLTGTGFLTNSVVNVNGTALATTYISGTSLSAIIPASYFQTIQTLSLTVFDPTQSQTSSAVSLAVSSPTPVVVFTGPGTTQPSQQPTITFTLTNPYPVVLNATLTLSFAGIGGSNDPAIQFATGGTTYSFSIPANTTQTPVVQIQSGTDAGAITVTLALSAGGQNVTPATLQPVVITIPQVAPGITSATLTRSGDTITVNIIGYSDTRDMTTATFHFVASAGNTINDPDFSVPAAALFSAWFSTAGSQAYGSEFTYTQIFNLSTSNSVVGQVNITLTNSAGISTSVTAQ